MSLELEMKPEYPGYELWSVSVGERRFRSCAAANDEIVEVYGNFRVVTKNGESFWEYDTLAILRGDDVTLWHRLELRDPDRNHPSLFVFRLVILLGSMTSLTILQSVLAYWFLGPFNFRSMLGIVPVIMLISLVESLVFPRVVALLRLLKLRIAIWRWMFTNKKTNAYYRDLLSRLKQARDKERAWAAGLLHRFF